MGTDPQSANKRHPSPTFALLASLALAIGALVLFGWLAEDVGRGELAQFDLNVRSAIHQLASPGATRAFTAISFLGSPQFLASLFVVAMISFLAVHWDRAAAWLALSMAGEILLDVTLKRVFHRARPSPFFGAAPHSYSFPSGHALGSFCFYVVLAGVMTARVRRRWLRIVIWTVAAILVVAIGLSRVYLGVHYPSDVVAGYAAAAVWVGSLLSVDRWRTRR